MDLDAPSYVCHARVKVHLVSRLSICIMSAYSVLHVGGPSQVGFKLTGFDLDVHCNTVSIHKGFSDVRLNLLINDSFLMLEVPSRWN